MKVIEFCERKGHGRVVSDYESVPWADFTEAMRVPPEARADDGVPEVEPAWPENDEEHRNRIIEMLEQHLWLIYDPVFQEEAVKVKVADPPIAPKPLPQRLGDLDEPVADEAFRELDEA